MSQSVIFALGVLLILLSLGGVAFALFAPNLGGGNNASRRLKTMKQKDNSQNLSKAAQDKGKERRKQVEETLAKIEEQQQQAKKKVSLRMLLARAGLTINISQYYIASMVCGIVCSIMAWFVFPNIFAVGGIAFSASIGLPRWFLGFLAKRRQKAFVNEFANSIDVIVRGVEAGLPLNDCLQVIANEAAPPVGPEFKKVVEAGRIGIPIADALDMMYEHLPLPELNFFSIVLAIQSKTGGNLSEALRNLSTVLRSRKMLKAKIQALSSEAKASAMIIGALPPFVMGALFVTAPEYLHILFFEPAGQILLVGGGFWMLTGILVMKKMINFKI